MNINESPGKEYITLLDSLVLGDVMELPSPLTGLSEEKTTATLTATNGGTKWNFRLDWYGIEYGRAKAELNGQNLEFKVEQ